MDRPADAQLPAKANGKDRASHPVQKPPSLKNSYLLLYNAISAVLWAGVLLSTAAADLEEGYTQAYGSVFEYVKWTQTLAVMEVLHSAVGIVRAPVLTTVMQVSSRLLLVWGIGHYFPATTAASPAFSSMLFAWSITEVIRYGFFAINIQFGSVPSFLTWLRYNTFFILYPLGISSECWLVWKAVEPAKAYGIGLEWALIGVLAIYVPGSYILFTHMMAQRRKVLKGLKSGPKKTQ